VRKVNIIYNDLGFVTGFQCPYCSQPLSLDESHEDDVGTMFFTCPKCGETSSLAKSEERMRLEESLKEQRLIDRLRGQQLAESKATPVFNSRWIRVHPAVGLIGESSGAYYFGIAIPAIIEKKNADGDCEEREIHFLITDRGEAIPCVRDELAKRRWRLAYKVCGFENRWSLKNVKAYLNGEANVDPAGLYAKIRGQWTKYIEFPEDAYYDLVTLWTIGTYFFPLFNAYPYLYFGGIKRTGKTKALTLLKLLSLNAVFSTNISTSSLFRLIQSGRCTLLMDESESLSNAERKQDLRSLILAGYKRAATVWRTEKDAAERLVPESFEVYSPKALANIAGLEDTLEDRCISIIMQRGRNRGILNSEPDERDPVWQETRDELHVLALKFWREINSLTSEVSVVSEEVKIGVKGASEKISNFEINARDLEIWKPILTLAKFFDKYLSPKTKDSDKNVPLEVNYTSSQTTQTTLKTKESDENAPSEANYTSTQTTQTTLLERMLRLARRKIEAKHVENVAETGEYVLAETLLRIVQEDGYYYAKKIADEMAKAFDEDERWLTAKWVGRALKRLGFEDKRRVGTGVQYYLTRSSVEDLAKRLGIETAQNDEATSREPGFCEHCGRETNKCYVRDGRLVWLCDKCLANWEGSL
jgi:Zn ribbon nucleic-acid-binding protein